MGTRAHLEEGACPEGETSQCSSGKGGSHQCWALRAWYWGVGVLVTPLLTLGFLHISTTGKNSSIPEFPALGAFLCFWFWGVTELGGKKAKKNEPRSPSPSIVLGHSVANSSAEPCAVAAAVRGHSPVRDTPSCFPGVLSREPWGGPHRCPGTGVFRRAPRGRGHVEG